MKLKAIAAAIALAVSMNAQGANVVDWGYCEHKKDVVQAQVTLKDGKVITGPIVDKRVSFTVGETGHRLNFSQLQKVEGFQNVSGSQYNITLTNIAGVTVRTEKTSGSYFDFYIPYRDEISMDRVCMSVHSSNLQSLTFGEHTDTHGGSVMRNERTGDFFPPFYLYDPYTGEALTAGKP